MASLARLLEGLPGRLVKLASVYRWTKARVIRDVAGARTLQRHLQELLAYLEANRSALVNYAARHRRGEPISTAFFESAINEIVARRMIKRQQIALEQMGRATIPRRPRRRPGQHTGGVFPAALS